MNAALKLMTADEFLVWSQGQDESWELVGGHPTPRHEGSTEMMTGATERHDLIVTNLIANLHQKLRRGPCRVKTADQATAMPAGNIRRPDVTVDCGPPSPDSLSTTKPTVVIEVLSPSTRLIDLVKKTEEYKTLESLRHIVLMEADTVKVMLWTRIAEGWHLEAFETIDAIMPLTAIGVNIALADAYEGVTLVD